MCIYGHILERSDDSFQHQVMSHDTRAENCIWPQFCAFSANFQWEEKCRISSFFLWLEILARFCRERPGPDPLERGCVSRDGHFRTLDFSRTGEKHYIIIHGKGAEMTVTDLHHPTMYSFLGGLSLESPPKNLN